MSGTTPLAKRIEPQVSPNAPRYLKKDERGRIVKAPAEMFERVAAHVADVERRYGADPRPTAETFYEAMARLEFLPNSPALMNAGTRLDQLAACFVLPIDDSLDGIFNSLRDAALIHQTGGGVGYDFSRHITEIPPAVRRLFPTAHEISAEQHIRIQAASQAHVDNAVSKTINFPADATASQMTDG